MDRAEKQELVAALRDVFNSAGVIVVAHNTGLSVAQMTDYRRRMKQAGGRVKVAKNRLVKLALEGTDAGHIRDLMQGPTLLAYSDDPVIAPKITVEYARGHERLVVLGGAMGPTALDAESMRSLASLPSLDELRARLVGMVRTPSTRIAQVVQAPGGQIARVLNARAEQDAAA